MERRTPPGGFTVIEVVIALGILVVGTAGVAAMVSGLMARSSKPALAEQATFFCAERLNYFRGLADHAGPDGGTVNGFVAAGGSYYPPPDTPGYNTNPAFHNVASNKVPRLFVREYIYEPTESKDADLKQLLGQRNQRRDFIQGTSFARNEIPTTPLTIGAAQVVLVQPNDEAVAAAAAPTSLAPNKVAIAMPRVNDNLRGPGFSMADRSLKFVREVWVQVNHPEFAPAAMPGVGAPALVLTPPYTVAVTVRVYAKDPRILTYDKITLGSAGVGYSNTKPPLAEMVGFFGLP